MARGQRAPPGSRPRLLHALLGRASARHRDRGGRPRVRPGSGPGSDPAGARRAHGHRGRPGRGGARREQPQTGGGGARHRARARRARARRLGCVRGAEGRAQPGVERGAARPRCVGLPADPAGLLRPRPRRGVPAPRVPRPERGALRRGSPGGGPVLGGPPPGCEHGALARGDHGAVRPHLPIPAGHRGPLARRVGGRGAHLGPVHAGQVLHRALPGTQQLRLGVRGGGLAGHPHRLGLLRRPGLLFRGRAHPGLCPPTRVTGVGQRCPEGVATEGVSAAPILQTRSDTSRGRCQNPSNERNASCSTRGLDFTGGR